MEKNLPSLVLPIHEIDPDDVPAAWELLIPGYQNRIPAAVSEILLVESQGAWVPARLHNDGCFQDVRGVHLGSLDPEGDFLIRRFIIPGNAYRQ